MKTSPLCPSQRGFTLIEILVVITIIAGLAAISFAVFNKMPDKAKAQKASVACTTLAGNVNDFMTDHQGALPVVDGIAPTDKSFTTAFDSPENMITVLLAKESTPEEFRMNRKGIRYLTGEFVDVKQDGVFQSPSGTEFGFYDPWGSPYYVIFDHNFDDAIPNPFDKSKREIFQKVIVFGVGPDKAGSDHDNKLLKKEFTEDNVYSWKQK